LPAALPLSLAALAISAGLAVSSSARHAAARAPTPREYSCPILPAGNALNRDISREPVNPNSARYIASIGEGLHLHADFGSNPGYGIPFAVVGPHQPKVPIEFTEYGEESDPGPYPVPAGAPVEGAGEEGDQHVLVVQEQTCILYELYHARRHGGGWQAGSGAKFNLRSNALRPDGWTSADAAGLPILPGLLNYSQVRAAVKAGKPITHAIRFTAQSTQSAYLWPARHEAGSGANPSLPPMGARFRLKGSFNVAGFCASSAPYCADAQAVLTEMQHYGLILADNGSNWFFQGSAYPQWPDALVSLLKQIPARDFQAVDESCLMVSPNSGRAAAKPGCPIG
jgi:hypothetical protein